MRKFILAALLLLAPLQAQTIDSCQKEKNCTLVKRFFNDANSNLKYICTALQRAAVTTSYSVTGSTLTNIVVASNVGTITFPSTFQGYDGMLITVSGSATTALNGTYVITSTPTSTTALITTSGVSNGTYNDSTLTITTTFPLLNALAWKIDVNDYNGGSVLAGLHQATLQQNLACSSRTSY